MNRLLALAATFVLAAAPLTARADPAGDVRRAGEKFAQLKYFHATMTSRGVVSEVDCAAPDRFRVTTPAAKGPSYIIGAMMYVNAGGHYMSLPMPGLTAMMGYLRTPAQATKFAATHQIKDLGPSSVDGVAVHTYGFDDTSHNITTHNVLAVGEADGLPHRMTITGTQGATVINYSRFNVPVTINAPS
jgi:hypothetical protein